jgi:hypothetical protein
MHAPGKHSNTDPEITVVATACLPGATVGHDRDLVVARALRRLDS